MAPAFIHSFIHHHFSIQLFAAVFIRSSHALLLHPSLGCNIQFIHHHFSIQLFAAVFIRLSHALLLHPALCCNIQSLIPTHSFFIHRGA
jgi:hypothetical protein